MRHEIGDIHSIHCYKYESLPAFELIFVSDEEGEKEYDRGNHAHQDITEAILLQCYRRYDR